MEISYKNSFADLIKFNLYHLPTIRLLQILLPIWLLFMSHAFYTIWQKTQTSIAVLIIGMLLHDIFWLLVMGLTIFLVVVLSYLPRLNKSFITQHTIAISQSGLSEATAFNRTEYQWPGIVKISQNRHYFFVYTSQHGSHVIPRRAFADAASAQAFFDAMRHWWQLDNGR